MPLDRPRLSALGPAGIASPRGQGRGPGIAKASRKTGVSGMPGGWRVRARWIARTAGLVVTAAAWSAPAQGAAPAVHVTMFRGRAFSTHVQLTPGRSALVRWTRSGQGTHTLTVSGAGLAGPLRLEGLSMAAVMANGPSRVVVGIDGAADCGTAGCPVVSEAYVPGARRFEAVTVPGAFGPEGAYFFQLGPHSHRFVPLGFPVTTTLFGFASVTSHGTLKVATPLYDALSHVAIQAFRYAPGSSGPGRWVLDGSATYGPDAPWTQRTPASAKVAVSGFFTDASLGLMRQALSITTDPGALRSRAYRDVRQVLGSGNLPSLGEVRVTGAGRVETLRAIAYETAGHGAALSLVEASVRASLVRVHAGAWRIRSVTLRPIGVRLRTVEAMLAAIVQSPSMARRLHGAAWRASAAVSGPGIWQVVVTRVRGSVSLVLYVNAATGAVHAGV